MPMIQFKRVDKNLEVRIQSGVLNYEYNLTWNCNDDVYAELLKDQFNKHMEKKLESIRREAYDNGWRDAKGHKKRSDWFSRWW